MGEGRPRPPIPSQALKNGHRPAPWPADGNRRHPIPSSIKNNPSPSGREAGETRQRTKFPAQIYFLGLPRLGTDSSEIILTYSGSVSPKRPESSVRNLCW